MNKIIALLLAGLISLAFAAPAAAQDSTLERIAQQGVLRVGMADSPPSQSKNPATDEWEGMNVEMAKDLARVLGVQLEIVDSTWSTLIPGLQAQQFDIAMVDMFATPERAKSVIFTDAYTTLGYSFIVAGDSRFHNWRELNDPSVEIATLSGTSGESFVQQYLPLAKMRSIVSDNNYAPHMEVMNKRADAHITDHVNNVLFIKNNPGAGLRTLPADGEPLLNATGLAYAIRVGDPHFHAFLNTWIRYLRDSGQIDELQRTWFGL